MWIIPRLIERGLKPRASGLGKIPTLSAVLASCLLLAGCDRLPNLPPRNLPVVTSSAILSAQTETLSPDEIDQVMDTEPDSAYLLGANDVISVTVYDHPEMSVPVVGQSSTVGGALITSDGTVELPLIGKQKLGGLTIDQAQQLITDAFRTYLHNPQINVQLVQAQSLRYYLLGSFTSPGIKYPARQLTLLEALALGGSVEIDQADLYQAYVAQGRVKLPVDLHALLVDGDLTQNVLLASGDTVVVPSTISENAYFFGSVLKPGPVQFQSGALSLLAGLASAGLDLTNYTNGRLERIHIIRSHGASAEFLIIDARLIMNGHAAPFQLEPGDIVFVPPTEVATWNEVLSQLLPSLQTVSDVLNPFVSLKYLRQRN